jgi:hypothetical protein
MRLALQLSLLCSLVFLAPLHGCGSTSTSQSPTLAPEDDDVPRPPQGIAPQPYTAAALRASHPVGTFTRYRLVAAGQPTVEQQTEWIECDREGCVMQSTIGTGEPQRGETRWWELRNHASFPAEHTTVSHAPLTVAAGTFDCTHYAVADPELDGGGIHHFWFDTRTAGSPVLFTHEVGGSEVLRMELLATNRR